MRYILDQKDIFILNKIYELFGASSSSSSSSSPYPRRGSGSGKVTLRSGTDDVYRYTVTGFKVLNDVIAYFKLFPLQTKKALSFEK